MLENVNFSLSGIAGKMLGSKSRYELEAIRESEDTKKLRITEHEKTERQKIEASLKMFAMGIEADRLRRNDAQINYCLYNAQDAQSREHPDLAKKWLEAVITLKTGEAPLSTNHMFPPVRQSQQFLLDKNNW